MAIQQGLTTSFKHQIILAQQNLSTDVLWIALYTAFSDIGPNTTVYTTDNEVVGSGYTAGGQQLQNITIGVSSDGVIFIDFDNVVWPASSFTARGALIYNVTQANASVAILDFGADKTCVNQTFTVTMPANTSTTALIRFP